MTLIPSRLQVHSTTRQVEYRGELVELTDSFAMLPAGGQVLLSDSTFQRIGGRLHEVKLPSFDAPAARASQDPKPRKHTRTSLDVQQGEALSGTLQGAQPDQRGAPRKKAGIFSVEQVRSTVCCNALRGFCHETHRGADASSGAMQGLGQTQSCAERLSLERVQAAVCCHVLCCAVLCCAVLCCAVPQGVRRIPGPQGKPCPHSMPPFLSTYKLTAVGLFRFRKSPPQQLPLAMAHQHGF